MESVKKIFYDVKVGDYIYNKSDSNKLGEGRFGKVYKGMHKKDKELKIVVKVISKKGNLELDKYFDREIEIIKILQSKPHRNILHCLYHESNEENIYLITEYCDNGDLDKYLKKQIKLDEETICHFFKQIGEGLNALNELNILHRNIKPQNILLCNTSSNFPEPKCFTIKLADFGLLRFIDIKSTLSVLDTSIYIAPEVYTQNYNAKADLWSVGMIMLQCVAGDKPNMLIVSKMITDNCSDSLKDLISRLIKLNVNERMNLLEFRTHQFFTQTDSSFLFSMKTREPSQKACEFMKIQDANKITFRGVSYDFSKEDFIFVEDIARTGRNIVERHKHKLSKEYVVIKFIYISDSVPLEKFNEEIEIHKRLNNSQYSVKYYGFAIYEDYALIFMESMAMSLSDLYKIMHKTFNYFPELLWVYIAVKLIKALVDLRERGIIHRDIKPANILINDQAEIKLCDFEFSKIMEGSVASTFVGTILYWPPERFDINNIEKYDDRSEVWSLGITLAEVAYGNRPLGENLGRKNDYILMQKEIVSLCKEEFIKKCFKGYSDKILAWINECLLPYVKRSKILELDKSEFFRSYLLGSLHSFISEYYLKHINITKEKLILKNYLFSVYYSPYTNTSALITGISEDYIPNSVMMINYNNVCDMLSLAVFYNCINLKNACMNFIELNADFIIKSEVTYNNLLEIISHDMLVADEIDIFEATYKWVKENKPEGNKKDALFKQIILSLIEIKDLINAVKPTSLFTPVEILEAIQERVNNHIRIKSRAIPRQNVTTIEKGAKVIKGTAWDGKNYVDPTQALFNGECSGAYVFHYIKDEPIIIKLFKPYMLDSIGLLLADFVFSPQSYYIGVSNDGNTYNKICERKEQIDWQLITFERQIVQYIRIVGTNNSAFGYLGITHLECPAQLRTIEEVSKKNMFMVNGY